MTRQKIIEQIQICRNAKCCDCQYRGEEDGYPECMENMMEGIGSHIIHELQQIDKIMTFCEKMANWHIDQAMKYNDAALYVDRDNERRIAGIYIRIMNELKESGCDEEEN